MKNDMRSPFLARYIAVAVVLLIASCGGGGGGGNSSLPVDSPIVSLSLSPLTVVAGQVSTITWSASNATSCVASDSWSGDILTSGAQTTSQATVGSYIYSLTCTGPGGSGSAQAILTVNPIQAPTVSISLTPASVAIGQPSTLTWSTTNATACTANGAWSGTTATKDSQSVSQSAAGIYPYGLDCTGPGGSASSSATLTVTSVSNSLPVVMDGGPLANPVFNIPFVSVTVCEPGTANCQTIDHVLVDTGSSGLRLIKPGVLNASLNLPAVTSSSGNALGECAVFADGFAWGSVRRADIKLAGEIALNAPIQTVGDNPGGVAGIPNDCSSTGANKSTAASMGANGILGVGLFANDCDVCLVSVIPATYYSCPASGCSGTKVTPSQIIMNPVALFPQDNNGVVIVLPSVGNAGATNPTGSLIFGIGTQADNTFDSPTVVFAANSSGRFSTTYKGTTVNSFIDSGSNGIFFADATIRQCTSSVGFYCPANPLSLSATNIASGGVASGLVNFSLVNVDALAVGVTAANAGGTAFGHQFDWGIPFFFGRKVFTAIQGADTPSGPGPYWAY